MTELEQNLQEWLSGRPEVIKEMAEKLKPWERYRLKPTGQHCTLYSYSENGTVTITVGGHDSEPLDAMNKMTLINVFGIDPNELELLS